MPSIHLWFVFGELWMGGNALDAVRNIRWMDDGPEDHDARAPTEPPDDAQVGWAIVRTEEHLKAIRLILAWILFLTLASLVAGIVVAVQLADETSAGF